MIVEVEKGENAVIDRKILLKDALPHCKQHGAMIRVTPAFENKFSIWRCPICHVGCLYNNDIKDVHPAFLDGTPKKHRSELFEKNYLKLQSLLSKNKLGYKVLGLSSLYLQGFDIIVDKISLELNKDDLKKIEQELKDIALDITPVERVIQRFEVESVDEIKTRLNKDNKLKSQLEKNLENDKELKKFFEI